MSRRQLRLIPYNGAQGYVYYLDGLRVDGKRKRLYFKTKPEAELKLRELVTQQRREGDDGLNLPADLRNDAARCARLLKPFGASLVTATEFYVAHLERVRNSLPVGVVLADYIQSKERAGFSFRHLRDIRHRLSRFGAEFADHPIKNVAVRDLEDWIHALSLGPQSLNNYRAVLNAFFEYAAKRELVDKNPIAAIDKVKLVDKAPEIFTPEQLAQVLTAASPELLPLLAIQAFCGLRTAEVLRLDWSLVDQVRGHVTVSAKSAKTAKRRLVPIPPNLAQWLEPCANRTGLIWNKDSSCYHREIQDLLRTTTIEHWPPNALRHSFASYHLAMYQNAAELALLMGHTTTKLIFSAYRELVRPEEASVYWNIKPNRPENVVPMTHVV